MAGNRYVHGSIRSHRGELWSTTDGDFMVEMNIFGGEDGGSRFGDLPVKSS